MREILFRGFNRKNNRWLYGCYIQNRGSLFVCPDEFAEGKSWQDYEVDPATIGQYTGQHVSAKDSHGDVCRSQKVFEHDILAAQNGYVLGCVTFSDVYGWMVGAESLYDYTDRFDDKEALIIGNIHDNPELLKGGES